MMYYEMYPYIPALTNTRSVNLVLAFAVTATDLPIPGILCKNLPEISQRSEERRGDVTNISLAPAMFQALVQGEETQRWRKKGGKLDSTTYFYTEKCCLYLFNTKDGKHGEMTPPPKNHQSPKGSSEGCPLVTALP